MNPKLLFMLVTLIPTIGNAQAKTYTNSINKYSLEYSADWLLKETKGDVTVYAPLESQSDKEYENCGVNIYPALGMTLDQNYKTYSKDLPSAFSEFQKVEEGDWELNGIKAKWMEVRFKDGPKSISNLICLLVNNDRLFILVGYSSTEKYPAHKEKFIAIMKSLKIG